MKLHYFSSAEEQVNLLLYSQQF